MTQQQIRDRLAVVVREGLKGNHLLFAAQDLSDALQLDDSPSDPLAVDRAIASELGSAGLQLAHAQSLEEARALIAGLSVECRAALARLYLRFLARCAAVKGQAN